MSRFLTESEMGALLPGIMSVISLILVSRYVSHGIMPSVIEEELSHLLKPCFTIIAL